MTKAYGLRETKSQILSNFPTYPTDAIMPTGCVLHSVVGAQSQKTPQGK